MADSTCVRSLVPAALLALLTSCGSDGDDAPDCTAFVACGGEVEGDWEVREVCFPEPGVLFEGLADGGECDDAVLDVTTEASGMRSYDADGNVEVALTLTTEFHTFFFKDCIRAARGDPVANINSAQCAAWESSYTNENTSASCVLRDDGCDCNIVRQDEVMRSSTYELQGDDVIEGEDPFPYCVDGDYLVLSIQIESLTGNVVLKAE